MLARYKEAEIGDAALVAGRCNLYERVIYRCVIGSQAFGLAGEESDIDRRGIYLPPADLHWSLYGVPDQLENEDTQEAYPVAARRPYDPGTCGIEGDRPDLHHPTSCSSLSGVCGNAVAAFPEGRPAPGQAPAVRLSGAADRDSPDEDGRGASQPADLERELQAGLPARPDRAKDGRQGKRALGRGGPGPSSNGSSRGCGRNWSKHIRPARCRKPRTEQQHCTTCWSAFGSERTSDNMKISIPKLSLVVLIGPSGSGKSTFARKHFSADRSSVVGRLPWHGQRRREQSGGHERRLRGAALHRRQAAGPWAADGRSMPRTCSPSPASRSSSLPASTTAFRSPSC